MFAPGLQTLDEIKAVVGAVGRPVNVIMGYSNVPLLLDALAHAGVKRVSVGAALARTAFAAFLSAADELAIRGSFGFMRDAVPEKLLSEMFANRPSPI